MNSQLRTIITVLLFIGSIAVIAVTLVLVVKEKKRAHVIQDEIHTLELEKKRFEHENIELQDRISYLKSAHSYEKEAKKLNYKKPGEHVVVVRRASGDSGGQEVVEKVNADSVQKKEHYRVWFEYFF